jgi:hypothetical protein
MLQLFVLGAHCGKPSFTFLGLLRIELVLAPALGGEAVTPVA